MKTDLVFVNGAGAAITELSLEQLSYLAAKARLPKKLVLDAGKETVERFMIAWKAGLTVQKISAKVVTPINNRLDRIPLVGEVVTAR